MDVFQSYIAEGGLIRLILIGAIVYMYSKQNKRIAGLSEKIDFLKVDNYISENDYVWLKKKIDLRDYYRSN